MSDHQTDEGAKQLVLTIKYEHEKLLRMLDEHFKPALVAAIQEVTLSFMEVVANDCFAVTEEAGE